MGVSDSVSAFGLNTNLGEGTIALRVRISGAKISMWTSEDEEENPTPPPKFEVRLRFDRSSPGVIGPTFGRGRADIS
jgi:hypothetical protein